MWFLLPSSLLAFVFFPYSPQFPVPDSSESYFLLHWTYPLLRCPYVFYQFQSFHGISQNHGKILSLLLSLLALQFHLKYCCLSLSPPIPKTIILISSVSWRKCCLCLAPGCSGVISLPLLPSVCSDLVTATPLPIVTSLQDALELHERIFRIMQIRQMSKSWWCCSFIGWS